MRSLAALESALRDLSIRAGACSAARRLLDIGEEILEQWILARGDTPTQDSREGFRMLALHRQGTNGDPSFNACRETCREVVYHFNLVTADPEHPKTPERLEMMRMVCNHLYLFVSGKLEVAGLGDFCCSSRPLRQTVNLESNLGREA